MTVVHVVHLGDKLEPLTVRDVDPANGVSVIQGIRQLAPAQIQ